MQDRIVLGIAGSKPSSAGTGSALDQIAPMMKMTMTRDEAMAARLIELGTRLGGSSPDWTHHDGRHVTGTWHDWRIDLRFLCGPQYPMDHWQVHITSESGMGFRSDDLEVYPRRLISAEYLALYFMRSQMMFDMTS